MIKNIESLCNIAAIAGFEKEVSEYLSAAYKDYCDEIVYDNLGSVFAVKKSKKENAPRVMVSANMDEVGLMIKEIHKNGLLSFLPIGALSVQALLNQRVRIVGDSVDVQGVVISTVESAKEVKDLKIDLGLSTDEQVKEMGIGLGDQVVFADNFITQGDLVVSKNLNNRVSCGTTIEVLKELKDEEFDFDLYVGATVQSEVGVRGGTTATGKILPDLGIVLACGDLDETLSASTRTAKMGKGVLLRFYDKGMMPNRGLLETYEEVCKKEKIEAQTFFTMGDNDGAWIHKLYQGCPVLNIGVGVRNIRTANSMASIDDITKSKDSCIAMIRAIDAKEIQGFKESNR